MTGTTMSQLADYRGPSLGERLRPMRNALRNPWRAFRRRLLRRPGSTLGMALACIASGAILTNALALQTERHPSPMFSALTDPRAEAHGPTLPAAPLPPARPQGERRAEAPAQKDAKVKAARDEPQRTASIAPNPRDQISMIIAETAAPTAAPGPSAEADRARIAAIQKALNKAGFGPLKADGAFGAGSRAALEKFEAERKLPVRGEPQGRSIRELARVTGMALD